LQRNSSDNFNFAKIGFELIDHDRKGYINASDIQRLSNDVGKNIDNNEVVTTKISIDEAKAMIETTNDMFAQNYNNDDNNDDDDNNHRLESVVFQKLFTSPFP
jgi:Ca2+-binding EF-hand superfamily protein